MDAPGFDTLAKTLSSPASRRSTLMALLGGIIPLRREEDADARRKRGGGKGKRKPGGSACRTESTADAVVTTRSARLKKKKLSATAVVRFLLPDAEGERSAGSTSTTTVRKGKALLLETRTTPLAEGGVEVRVAYGSAYGTAAEARFVVEGDTVRGEIAGRPIVPFPAADPPEELAFEDGAPAPQITARSGVQGQIQTILGRLSAVSCSNQKATAETRRVSMQTNALACELCLKGCAAAMWACQQSLQMPCLPLLAIPFVGYGLYAACFAAEFKVCWDAGAKCSDDCFANADCCPGPCGDICCFSGVCLRDGECCARADTPCHGVSCCPPGEACRGDGACCPPFTTPCGNSRCCPTGERCLNGACCPDSQVCGGTCCGNNCCNNVCCAPGEACDPNTGGCRRVCNPGLGEYACPSQPGYPTCCQENMSCCQSGDCCFAGWDCCPGSEEGCCAPGTECCFEAGRNICKTTCIR